MKETYVISSNEKVLPSGNKESSLKFTLTSYNFQRTELRDFSFFSKEDWKILIFPVKIHALEMTVIQENKGIYGHREWVDKRTKINFGKLSGLFRKLLSNHKEGALRDFRFNQS